MRAWACSEMLIFPESGPWRRSIMEYGHGDLSSPLYPLPGCFYRNWRFKEHFLTFLTYSGSSPCLALLGLILHLEVYWFAEISCLFLVYTLLRRGPYVLSAQLAWRGLTQMNGAIHSLIILGILAFGRGYGSSFKKEERRKKCKTLSAQLS